MIFRFCRFCTLCSVPVWLVVVKNLVFAQICFTRKQLCHLSERSPLRICAGFEGSFWCIISRYQQGEGHVCWNLCNSLNVTGREALPSCTISYASIWHHFIEHPHTLHNSPVWQVWFFYCLAKGTRTVKYFNALKAGECPPKSMLSFRCSAIYEIFAAVTRVPEKAELMSTATKSPLILGDNILSCFNSQPHTAPGNPASSLLHSKLQDLLKRSSFPSKALCLCSYWFHRE